MCLIVFKDQVLPDTRCMFRFGRLRSWEFLCLESKSKCFGVLIFWHYWEDTFVQLGGFEMSLGPYRSSGNISEKRKLIVLVGNAIIAFIIMHSKAMYAIPGINTNVHHFSKSFPLCTLINPER